MKIAPQTKENFVNACLSQAAVAKSLGLPKCTFSQVLNGTYPNLNGKQAQKAITFLREKGLLVLEQSDEPAEGATVAHSEPAAITAC